MTPWTNRQSSSGTSRVSFQNSPPDIHEIAYSPVQSTPLNMSTDSSALNSILVGSSSNINMRRPSVNKNKQLFAVVDDEDVAGSNNNNNVDVSNIGRRRRSSARSIRKRKGTSSSSRRSSSSRSRSGVKEEAQGYTLSGLVDGALTKITDVLFDNLGCDSACSGWMMDASTPSTCKIFTTQ